MWIEIKQAGEESIQHCWPNPVRPRPSTKAWAGSPGGLVRKWSQHLENDPMYAWAEDSGAYGAGGVCSGRSRSLAGFLARAIR